MLLSLPIEHVVTRKRNGAEPFRKLNLEYHARAKSKRDLADHQIEFPHPAESLVIHGGYGTPALHESAPP